MGGHTPFITILRKCRPLSSGGVTSGAGVSQGAADFILGRRHAGNKQHVGHRAQTIIRGQTALFLRTSRANRRGHAYACADIHRAPALPPTRLFVSTHPERHGRCCSEDPQSKQERRAPSLCSLVLLTQSDTWSWCFSEFATGLVIWTPEHHRRRNPPV